MLKTGMLPLKQPDKRNNKLKQPMPVSVAKVEPPDKASDKSYNSPRLSRQF